MEAGKLNRRIKIVTRGTLTPDGIGGFTVGNSTEVETWCSAKQLSMREQLLYGLEVGFASYKFTFRYDSVLGIGQDTKLKYEDRTFRVISVNEIGEAKRMIEVTANEQTD